MRADALKWIAQGLMILIREDKDAALCLLDWARCAAGRGEERQLAREEKRKPRLEPIELRQPSLADLGVNVVGCSACAVTPKNRVCVGCGNKGAAPVRKRKARR